MDLGRFKGFKLEADASEKGVVRSASFTMPVGKGLIKQVIAGKKGIGVLFSKDQVRFLKSVGGRTVDFDALRIFGPLAAHRWQFQDPACPWPLTAELWKRADGARLMEFSIKSPAAQAAVAIAGFMAFLAEVGAEQNVAEQTKTRWAMGQSAAGPSRPAGPAAKSRARAQASRPSRVRRR